MTMERQIVQTSVVIANGQTVSGVIAKQSMAMVGAVMPASFEGATLTFQVSADGTTYVELDDNSSGSAISATVAASKAVTLPAELAPWPFFKIVSGTQVAADRTIQLCLSS